MTKSKINRRSIYNLRNLKFFQHQLRHTAYIEVITDNDEIYALSLYALAYTKKGKTVPFFDTLIRHIKDINDVQDKVTGKNKINNKPYQELLEHIRQRKPSFNISYTNKDKQTGIVERYSKDITISYSTKESHRRKTAATNPVYEILKKCRFADYELELLPKHTSRNLPYISDRSKKNISFNELNELYEDLRHWYPQDYPILNPEFKKCESEPRCYRNGISFCNNADYMLDRYSFYSYRSIQDRYYALVGAMFSYFYSDKEKPSSNSGNVALVFAREAVGLFFVCMSRGIYTIKDLTADTLWYLVSCIISVGQLTTDNIYDLMLNYYIYSNMKKLFNKIEKNNTDPDFLKSYISVADTNRVMYPEELTIKKKEKPDMHYDGIDVVEEVIEPRKSVALFDGTAEDPNMEKKALRNEWKKNMGIERKKVTHRKSTERIEMLKDKVFELRGKGISMKSIAKELNINFRTVNSILKSK